MLLLLFLTIALSFCVLQFSFSENESVSDTTIHYAERETGKVDRLHITFSQRLTNTISKIFSSLRSAAQALPFFAVDMAEVIYEETANVFCLFAEVFSTERADGSLLV